MLGTVFWFFYNLKKILGKVLIFNVISTKYMLNKSVIILALYIQKNTLQSLKI